MTIAPMTPRQALSYYLAIPLGLGAVLAVIGPFGTYGDLGAGARLAYWAVIMLLGWLETNVVIRALAARLTRARHPLAWAAGLGCPAGALLIAGQVLVLESWFRPGLILPPFGMLYMMVLALTVGIALPAAAIEHLRARLAAQIPPPVPPVPAPSGGGSPFLRRIPAHLGRELLCLEMEDHYIRIHTRLGSDLILMRLRDAEAELAGIDGMRVHRSWWVVRAAVAAAERGKGRVTLRLANGLDVPVSRSYLPSLRAAGWLEG